MHEYIDFPGRFAIKVKRREETHFTYPWHFHREFELMYVIRGTGSRYVADSIQYFESDDLVLLGSNLPHFWRHDESYDIENSDKKLKYIVVQFPPDLFSDQISKYPEFRSIGDLLERSSRGIRFLPEVASQYSNLIERMSEVSGIERIILMLGILQQLAAEEKYEVLAGEFYQNKDFIFDNDRLNKVLHFINTHYQNKIELRKAAEISNLHPSAFCRYFKEKTGKSLLEYTNDMRISYACKLILEHRLTITQVCFETGFNNLSNFNRTFKKQTGYTPSDYYKQFSRS